ncbi:MAG: hypothetical protein Q4D19_01320 [Lautropia sp.]|nr:hypothetical protein [Lautropia sp.]
MSNEENPLVPATDASVQPLPQAASSDTQQIAQTEPSRHDPAPAGAAPDSTQTADAPPADMAERAPAPVSAQSPDGVATAGEAAGAPGSTPAEPSSPAAAPATEAVGTEDASRAAAPADVPAPPLPADIADLDEQVGAALKMVTLGANRLSKLAGNIRFAFLQRDEARLVSERKRLKADFAAGTNTDAELKFGLKTVLQKAERLAGSLMHVPAARVPAAHTATAPAPAENTAPTDLAASPASTDAPLTANPDDTMTAAGTSSSPAGANAQSPADEDPASPKSPDVASSEPAAATAQNASTPVAPALPVQRSGQIRQSIRKSMMALAPAAPLHLQIELAPEFADADPDIMAMAARIHAVHRQVLGSLRSILWHSPTRCTLGFEDGKTLPITFGEQGIEDLPPAFRQKQQSPSQKQSRPGDNRNGKSAGGRSQSRGASGNRRPGRDQQRPKTEGGNGDASQPAAEGSSQRDGASRRSGNGQAGRHEGRRGAPGENRNPQGKPRQHGRPARPQGEQKGGEQGQHERRHPRGPRNDDRHRGNRPAASGAGPRPGKPAFPGNSAMADKLREALGGLNLSQKKREGAE